MPSTVKQPRVIASSYKTFFQNLPVIGSGELSCNKCDGLDFKAEFQKKSWLAEAEEGSDTREKVVLNPGIMRIVCNSCGNQQWAKPKDHDKHNTLFSIYNDKDKKLIENTNTP